MALCLLNSLLWDFPTMPGIHARLQPKPIELIFPIRLAPAPEAAGRDVDFSAKWMHLFFRCQILDGHALRFVLAAEI